MIDYLDEGWIVLGATEMAPNHKPECPEKGDHKQKLTFLSHPATSTIAYWGASGRLS